LKLRYNKEKRFRLLFPIDLLVEKGTEFETENKDEIKRLKDVGFIPVRESKKKEDDE
jgi:hypothetical protein